MKMAIVFCFVLLGVFLSVIARSFENFEKVNKPPATMPLSTTTNPSPRDVLDDYGRPISKTTPSAAISASIKPPKETKCECGIFKGNSSTEYDSPILSHSLMSVSCDFDGQKECIKTCTSLADTCEDYGPQLLCAALGHYNQLMPSMHSRICGSKQWIYAGFTSSATVCCHEYQVIDCSDIENFIN